MLMVNDRSVHSRLSAHAVYPPPPNRRRCLVCVRNQILGIMEMHVIGLLSTWEIPFAEKSASILASVFSAFVLRLRSWFSIFYVIVFLVFLVVVVFLAFASHCYFSFSACDFLFSVFSLSFSSFFFLKSFHFHLFFLRGRIKNLSIRKRPKT